jgi:phosphoglycolate phosphatase-like HAD superfamily hydrolase
MFSTASFSGSVEFITVFSARPQISRVIFDFDGTLSWLRHGWPEIMVRLFWEHWPIQPDESEEAIRDLLLNDVLSLNGKPSIYQMIKGAERVQQRGGPALDPETLRQEYERRLDTAIQRRAKKILAGEEQPDAYVVHGARSFLERLRQRGCTLIILSGTAEARVKQEAGLLGLEHFFGTHIYGSTADHGRSSKQAVIDRLLREEAITGDQLLSFGDGPVEIQLTKQAGGLAVAVASDEDTNGSGNIHPQKRTQLSAAGADLLIPDYRDGAALLECLWGK